MLLIPEIETVVILVPRAGSTSLKRSVLAKYPNAMMLYRHMEADGVPFGYDRWQKIGIVRHPAERLWSLYKFLKNFNGEYDPAYIEAMRNSVLLDFSEWVVNNQIVFTSPYDRAGLGRFFPQYTNNHPMPENQKSQFVYLRPDLGTKIFKFTELSKIEKALGIKLPHYNKSSSASIPALSDEAQQYVELVFKWDFEMILEKETTS